MAALVAYVAVVALQSSFRNSDWPHELIEGTLLRTNPAHLYDVATEAALQRQVLGPGGYLPRPGQPAGVLRIVDPPWAAMAAVPFAALGLFWGGLLWVYVQFLTLVAGLLLLARDRTDALLATATIPTWVLLANANWVGPVVLGIALCWRLRERHPWLAGLALGIALVRPNYLLTLLAAFLIAREWRLLGGVAVALVVGIIASELIQKDLMVAWLQAASSAAGQLGADISPAGLGWLLGSKAGWLFAAAGLVVGLAMTRARGPGLLPASILAAPHALMPVSVLIPAGLALGRRCGFLELALLNLGSIALVMLAGNQAGEALLGTALVLGFVAILASPGLPIPFASSTSQGWGKAGEKK